MTGSAKRFRTTSACAENTWCGFDLGAWVWNYLRVRGEYDQRDMDTIEWLELPPRARRIRG